MQPSLNRCREHAAEGQDTEWQDVSMLLKEYDARLDEQAGLYATNKALLERLSAVEDALKDAIADARSNAEERDEAKAQVISDCIVLNQLIDALRAEVAAWRVVDRLATGTDTYRKAYIEARRIRAQNEGGERG